MIRQNLIWSFFRKLRWYLTLTYNLATLAAIFLLFWWGFLVGIVYLQRTNPGLSWVEIIAGQVLPALRVIAPSLIILIIPATLISAYFGYLNARWLDLRFKAMYKAVQAWKLGDFSITIQEEVADEISSFGRELNAMAFDFERLLQNRQDLAVLEERSHLAYDLHDSVKQQITAASFQIGAAKKLVKTDPQAALVCLQAAEELNHEAHQELNAIIFELRPDKLQAGDLERWISEYVDGWSRRNHIEVHLQLQEKWHPAQAIQENICRVLQEALANIARHSRATQVEIRISRDDERQDIELLIRDNGCGFELESAGRDGFGLKTMRARVNRAGGKFMLESKPGQGTCVVIRMPI